MMTLSGRIICNRFGMQNGKYYIKTGGAMKINFAMIQTFLFNSFNLISMKGVM